MPLREDSTVEPNEPAEFPRPMADFVAGTIEILDRQVHETAPDADVSHPPPTYEGTSPEAVNARILAAFSVRLAERLDDDAEWCDRLLKLIEDFAPGRDIATLKAYREVLRGEAMGLLGAEYLRADPRRRNAVCQIVATFPEISREQPSETFRPTDGRVNGGSAA
jgi:hypothetical protein